MKDKMATKRTVTVSVDGYVGPVEVRLDPAPEGKFWACPHGYKGASLYKWDDVIRDDTDVKAAVSEANLKQGRA